MKHAKKWTVAVALLATVALAQAVQRSLALTINGQRSTTGAIVVNGRTYVPVEALRAAGVTATQSASALALTVPAAPAASGGSNQVAGLAGCVNEQLFNGVWRLRVTNVSNVTDGDRKGTAVSIEVRNGTNGTTSLANSGAGGPASQLDNVQLVTQDGASYTPSGSIFDLQGVAARDVPQGAPLSFTLNFFPNPAANGQISPPSRLVFRVDRGPGTSYTVADPSFRVNLTCRR
ncbi:hypothetical protein [Deinococcus yavapaiensis]|uniref:Copper amine oxidase-like N-terminal domain-containing protein n=1 Tax=Deinococcus yavapaiensis KR-236 TaxID=694435 RepID=A0A318SRT0_9DEIO|nr:hypothetical protein [Deinococcus yavapaiensis]PYE55797.1 hypothetical protein DES52_102162 [Deinococcus yavapaiensis KR-236]